MLEEVERAAQRPATRDGGPPDLAQRAAREKRDRARNVGGAAREKRERAAREKRERGSGRKA